MAQVTPAPKFCTASGKFEWTILRIDLILLAEDLCMVSKSEFLSIGI